MTAAIGWGIIGAGAIAGTFAAGLAELPDARLVAVGSRTAEGAAAFADRFGVPRRHASYHDLAADPAVDVVYVATPHPLHHPAVRLCLEAGKPVLCEKPFALNARQAADMVALARGRDLFLMEAMWTRFLPAIRRLREVVAAGAIGDPRLLAADFGFRHGGGPEHRLFDPALGGGALLDVGSYVVSLASMLFGPAEQAVGLARLGPTGVDHESAFVLRHAGGRLAQGTAAIRVATPQEATVIGTDGFVRVHPCWWRATRLTVTTADGGTQEIEEPYPGNGYQFEAAEVMRCLREGRRESDAMPPAETVAIAATMDQLRAQWGLRYPGE